MSASESTLDTSQYSQYQENVFEQSVKLQFQGEEIVNINEYLKPIIESLFISQKALLSFRILALSYFIALFIWRRIDFSYYPFYEDLKYMTVWGLVLGTTYYIIILLLYIRRHKYSRGLQRIAIIIFQIAFSIQLTITLVYWAIIYPAAAGMNPEDLGFVVDSRYILLTVNMHGGIFLVLWAELIVSTLKFRKNDLIYVLLFLFTYATLNFLYTQLKSPIYQTLDWKTIHSYLHALAAAVVSSSHFYLGYYYCENVKDSFKLSDDTLEYLETNDQDFNTQNKE